MVLIGFVYCLVVVDSDERLEESKNIIGKYPDRVPVSFGSILAEISCSCLKAVEFVQSLSLCLMIVFSGMSLEIGNMKIWSCWCVFD